jgi:phage-related minor tail protein
MVASLALTWLVISWVSGAEARETRPRSAVKLGDSKAVSTGTLNTGSEKNRAVVKEVKNNCMINLWWREELDVHAGGLEVILILRK